MLKRFHAVVKAKTHREVRKQHEKNMPELERRTQALTKGMGNFTARNNKLLRELRLNVSAHRNHDASAQFRMIESLDCAQILDVTIEFVDQNRLICNLLLELVTTAESKFLYFRMFETR